MNSISYLTFSSIPNGPVFRGQRNACSVGKDYMFINVTYNVTTPSIFYFQIDALQHGCAGCGSAPWTASSLVLITSLF